MAFAITALKAFGIEASEPVTSRFKQIVQISWTAAVGDVALDIGNLSGTFWTAAANSTLQSIWARIQAKADVITAFNAPTITDAKARVASGATLASGQYKAVTTPAGLAITSFAGEGVSGTLTLELLLKPQNTPEEYNYLS
jgi:hypothetical protein